VAWTPLRLPPLYPILDLGALAERGLEPLEVLDAWLASGVTFWQLRAKNVSSGALLDLLDVTVERSHRAGARVIVNDRVDLALVAGADGVHVGQTDLPPAAVRRVAAETFVVGLSTHTDEQVDAACQEPVSYVAIGPVFATTSKVGATDPAVGIEGVRSAAGRSAARRVPVVAIGGVTLEAAPQILAAGAASVAVISDLLIGNPAARIQQYQRTLSGLTL
jgi:thiamine-phosphate pyrophosphorylase